MNHTKSIPMTFIIFKQVEIILSENRLKLNINVWNQAYWMLFVCNWDIIIACMQALNQTVLSVNTVLISVG